MFDVKKYNYNSFDEIIGQDDVVKTLKTMTENLNIPHLIFYGKNGVGKSECAHLFLKELFKDNYRSRVLELKACDDRGIQVVREKIKSFAQNLTDEKMDVKFKFIILEEADMMTQEAQVALRRTIEFTSKVTRFCFICNDINKIIEPIQSRCSKVYFRDIDRDSMTKYIKSRNVKVSKKMLNIMLLYGDNDMRRFKNYVNMLELMKDEKIVKDVLNLKSEDDVYQDLNYFKTCNEIDFWKKLENIEFDKIYLKILLNVIMKNEKINNSNIELILEEIKRYNEYMDNLIDTKYMGYYFMKRVIKILMND
jgi:DNA polymerase III delta prime subunit